MESGYPGGESSRCGDVGIGGGVSTRSRRISVGGVCASDEREPTRLRCSTRSLPAVKPFYARFCQSLASVWPVSISLAEKRTSVVELNTSRPASTTSRSKPPSVRSNSEKSLIVSRPCQCRPAPNQSLHYHRILLLADVAPRPSTSMLLSAYPTAANPPSPTCCPTIGK